MQFNKKLIQFYQKNDNISNDNGCPSKIYQKRRANPCGIKHKRLQRQCFRSPLYINVEFVISKMVHLFWVSQQQ